MIPGPEILLRCSSCDHHVIRQTLTSGNTFSATLWTDGRFVTPMMPRDTLFEYWFCSKCGTFQKVTDMIEVDRKEYRIKVDRALEKLWKQAEPIEEPTWQQYLKGIKQWEEKLNPNPAWETDLRMLTWRRYNDEYRDKLERENNSWRNFFKKHEEGKKWIDVPQVPAILENCNNVASWLYEGNPDTAMNKADILRWLGRYELAIQLLETLPDLQVFDEVFHTKRYEKLLEMSQDRESALGIVSDDY